MSDLMFWILVGCFALWQIKDIYHDYNKYQIDLMYIEDSRKMIEDSRKMIAFMGEKSKETNEQINRLIEILGNTHNN